MEERSQRKMHEVLQSLKDLSNPWLLSRDALIVRSRQDYERLTLPQLEKVKVRKIVEILGHGELRDLVKEDMVTLAMIKPRTSENALGLSEVEAFYRIRKEIKKPLERVFEISVWFGPEDVEEFYAGGPKGVQVGRPSIRGGHVDRWTELKDYMTLGPTTFLLLFSARGKASAEWRKQIGHWDVQFRSRDQNTIRGRYAVDNYTSLVHGSDNPQAILREIDFLRAKLLRFI